MDTLTIALLIIIITLICLLSKNPNNFPPGPISVPLLGSLPAVVWASRKYGPLHETLLEFSKRHGKIFSLYLGSTRAICINGYDNVKNVLSREEFSNRPKIVTVTMKEFGKNHGVFFSSGYVWKEQRRFTLKNLRDFGFGKRSMEFYIHEETKHLIEFLDKVNDKNDVDLLSMLPIISINVLWTIMAGKRHNIDDIEFIKLTKAVMAFFRLGDPILAQSKFLQKIPIINRKFIEQLKAVAEIQKVVTQTIEEHFETFSEHDSRDFIDVYIKELKDKPTDSSFSKIELTAICMDLFNAGTETTASTVGFAIRYLIQYPEIQTKMRIEIIKVVGNERFPNIDDIFNLPYCQAVLAETLRHSALAPLTVPHYVNTDTELNGYQIPKDTVVFINLWSISVDPKLWDKPRKFVPERFLSEDGTLFKKYEYFIPFGTGPRACLGEPLARASTFLFLTSLVQNFKFEHVGMSPPESKDLEGFTRSPAPYKVKLCKL